MYRDLIQAILARQGLRADARHVEAYMRLEHPTLDGLHRVEFEEEVRIGAACATHDPEAAEELARSYGL